MSCCLDLILILILDFDFCVCWIDLGRYRQSSMSMSHTLKRIALAPKDVLRCLHLWFIFRT